MSERIFDEVSPRSNLSVAEGKKPRAEFRVVVIEPEDPQEVRERSGLSLGRLGMEGIQRRSQPPTIPKSRYVT